jgi:hypothetical protein
MISPSIIGRAAGLAATVTPLGLGAALIDVDTGQPGAPPRADPQQAPASRYSLGLIPSASATCR